MNGQQFLRIVYLITKNLGWFKFNFDVNVAFSSFLLQRRSEWNESEKHEARLLSSENLKEIERVCCCKLGLNPFSFHPDMLDPWNF